MGETRLRRATSADLPWIERLERRYMLDIEPEQLRQWEAGLDRNRRLWSDNLHNSVVLEVAGQATGFAIWTQAEPASTLITINVEPGARGQGYGRQLLDAFVARAPGALRLGVHERNPARRLYESAGWRFTGHDAAYRLYVRDVSDR